MTDRVVALHGAFGAHEKNGATWYDAAAGELMACASRADTNGAYTVIESVASPGCCVPLHSHQNEDEHFAILEGTYRFVCKDGIFDAPTGTSVTVPKRTRHAWRNVSDDPGRALVVFTLSDSEQIFQDMVGAPRAKIVELAARYGCFIVGSSIEA
jgi:mannose-6-phosphate isomerase-like protein (cupin superfamily)